MFVEAALDPAEGPSRLVRHAMREVERELAGDDSADRQATRLNGVLRGLVGEGSQPAELVLPPRVLYEIRGRTQLGDPPPLPPLPATPFSQSDLLVNAEGQPNIGSEMKAELASSDSVDLVCAFVIWTGVRHLRDALAEVVARGGRVRVITTTYMGATEKRAVDELFAIGAQIRVALDARTTKLHAKAWLLERGSGLSTAFVGSSNLSHTALFDGLEWNVRLSSADAVHVIDKVRMMFESHWASEHFDLYDPAVNGEALALALREHNRRSLRETSISFAGLDVRPYPHQQRMLDALMIERERHDRHRNLVVAATGTGKTVVAALDYRQLRDVHGSDLSLLFVAHREEIHRPSVATYRAVLRRGDFGEIYGGGRVAQGRHVSAMIQSLRDVESIPTDAFDVVVVDEFHHAAADSYDRLLNRLEPRELLGLTATPERLDGRDVTDWFDHRIAVELRLWEAIDQGFLVPFQYFGVADGTDLSQLTWRRGGYAPQELSNLLTGDDIRVAKLLEAVERIVLDPGRMRALGFCLSKEHAHYMARRFTDAGLASIALTGDDSPDVRSQGLSDLKAGGIRCVFSVEVLGEGVDIPDVDCLLLLRPTASATLFTQQLGRGLRRAQDKSSLTVIDLIGQQHREFRFEDRLARVRVTRSPEIDSSSGRCARPRLVALGPIRSLRSMLLLLLRHGQSTWNVERRWAGQADPPLSAEGRLACERLASALAGAGLESVASSDLVRARQTAGILARELRLGRVLVEAGLRERSAPLWSGLTASEIEGRWPEQLAGWRSGACPEIPGSEPWDSFAVRIEAGVAAVAGQFRGRDRVLVVTHAGALRAVEGLVGVGVRKTTNLDGYWVRVDAG
ncbi:MAG: histidine phosphatase family protein, partial [Actinomycetota bacterium]|nr:histidine phosphatase family protein [Actinomycetota bacterium]